VDLGRHQLSERRLWDLARASPLQCGGAEAWRQGPPPTTEQTRYDRGKKTGHTVKNVRLINVVLWIVGRYI
jgi:hypothetical protein